MFGKGSNLGGGRRVGEVAFKPECLVKFVQVFI